MAKMTKQLRRAVFESAVKKLYGDRIAAENELFEKSMESVIEKMIMRTAKENGVDYGDLTTKYRPYLATTRSFSYGTKSGSFRETLKQVIFNENLHVLNFEDARFDLVCEYREQNAWHYTSEHEHPCTREEHFSETEKDEIIALFKRYADFLAEVISSACVIRDVICSALTTKQLSDTSPELGALIPQAESCVALVPVETVAKVSALFQRTE